MSNTLRRRPEARRDLFRVADYLAQNSLAAAERFLAAAEGTMQALAGMPGMGSPWDTANPQLAGLRFFRVKGFDKYLLFYRPIDGGVEVVRILHAAQDLANIFEEGAT
jgi:toxin ParE1/3/4